MIDNLMPWSNRRKISLIRGADKAGFMTGISDAAAKMAGTNLKYADYIAVKLKGGLPILQYIKF